MTQLQDPDLLRSGSHQHMIGHLTGPFAAGAVDTPVAITAAGRCDVTWTSREPLLVAALLAPLGGSGLRLDAVLDPDGAATALPPLDFAPYTEEGAFLPLHRPSVDAVHKSAVPFSLTLSLTEIDQDGVEIPFPAARVAARVSIHLIEGNMGRLIYLLGAEKSRIRGRAREIAAMRLLQLARDDALDRMGAELGVPRFSDEIKYDAATEQIWTDVRTGPDGEPLPEPDTEYRRRLGLYQPLLVPNRSRLLSLLNGPGDDADPNQGPVGELGLAERFQVEEADNEFAVAIHLVSTDDNTYRDNFLQFIRGAHLVWPRTNVAADDVHAARFIPERHRQEVEDLRARLRARFGFSASAAIAPMLASALDRVGRCRTALGFAGRWRVLRAQDSNRGSRYELGLGIDLRARNNLELNRLGQRVSNPNRPPDADPEIERLLQSMTPRSAADDPEGRWFLEPCGLRTVHRVNNTRIYLSHLPTFGLVISGDSHSDISRNLPLEVRYHAPGDPGSNLALAAGLEAGLEQWTTAGNAEWTALTDADARVHWSRVVDRAPADPALQIFRSATLPAVETPDSLVQRLLRLPEELIETVRLDPVMAQAIVDGDPGVVSQLRDLVSVLRDQGLSSVLPLVTNTNDVLLVVAVIGLPEAGINLSDRRATGFRWYVVPIQDSDGNISSVGSRTVFSSSKTGLSAVMAIGYVRQGLTDPYEFRVDLPDGATVDLSQYEFLMNLLQHAYPIGVEINTFSIRQEHVDLDGDGNAEPLPPNISKTFRKFPSRRHRGEVGVNIEASG